MLAARLKSISKFIPDNSVVPALKSVKLTVTNNVMEILCNDNHSQIKVYCPVRGDDGCVCLPGKLFLETINLFRENEVVLTVKEKQDKITVELKNGKSKYNIVPDTFENDFPVMKVDKIENETNMHQFYLKMALKCAGKFINDDSSTINAHGMNIDAIKNRIIFTGLDNRLMCRVDIKPSSIDKWVPIVIADDAVDKVLSLLDDKGDISIAHDGKKIIFFTDPGADEHFEVISVASNAKFPNSESIFNRRPEHNIIINTAEFMDAVKRLKLYSSTLEAGKKIRLISNAENKNEIIITASDSLTGKEGEELMSVENTTGRNIDKIISANQILKILSNVEETDFNLYFADEFNIPCYIEPKVSDPSKENNLKFVITTFAD
jgi:DNA polymerase III sliding clamp (beta) subunit (PCNA family)